MNPCFSLVPSDPPPHSEPESLPAESSSSPRLGPEDLRIFRAPALPAFQPWWQDVPFTAHLGPRIREHV